MEISRIRFISGAAFFVAVSNIYYICKARYNLIEPKKELKCKQKISHKGEKKGDNKRCRLFFCIKMLRKR